jgi:hypothetical protein
MDEDRQALQSFLTRQGFHWPQLCDGKYRNSEIGRLFNGATAFPRHYLLDRQGAIVAKHVGAHGVPKMAEAVAKQLAKEE